MVYTAFVVEIKFAIGSQNTNFIPILGQEFEMRRKPARHKNGCLRQFLYLEDFDLRRIFTGNGERERVGRGLDRAGAAGELGFLDQAHAVLGGNVERFDAILLFMLDHV
jgi:hypothetical protein